MKRVKTYIAVIGSGPSGQKAAIQAAKLGKEAIVIEESEYIGGACLNSGTIPSKTLRAAILDLTGFYARSFYGKQCGFEDISISDLNFRLGKVWEMERAMIERQFRKNHVQIFYGKAEFLSSQQLLVHTQEGPLEIEAEKIIIASGSKPRNPQGIPFDDEVILDSSRLLKIDKVPKRLIVLGGGIIGTEYASFFAALGTEVLVVDKKDHMLPLLDREIGIHLETGLANLGLRFMGKKETRSIYRKGHRAVIEFADGTQEEGDALLYALGRVAQVEGLQIEKAGLKLSASGHIPVNAFFQTANPNIFAVGDVIGGACLASTSMEQGRLAARAAIGAEVHYFPSIFPLGIYTIPEISSCGYTEKQVKSLGVKYEVGRAYYYEIASSHISGDDTELGMFKILFHADTLEILGVHIVGRGATEVIHIGQVAMTFNAKVDYFINQVFNYPTYAEGYRIAALNGFNKIKTHL